MSQLLTPLDHVLDSRSKVRLLRALLRSPESVTGREASRLVGIDHKAVHAALDDLVNSGLVSRSQGGRSYLFKIASRDDPLLAALAALFEAEDWRRERIFEVLREAARAPSPEGQPVSALVIFGSAARGEDGPGSDVDLLVLFESSSQQESVQDLCFQLAERVHTDFGLRLSPVAIDERRFREMGERGEPLFEAVLKDGRWLLGSPETFRGPQ